ncbi:MAG: hypothetical protein 4 [Bactrocera oleae negev-like virus]|nr:MAG: hypothetical protein 4 [Bactrocera oleae negev-like virus]
MTSNASTGVSKPAQSNNPIELTDTIRKNTTQEIFGANAVSNSSAENAFGIKITRGGQVLGIGFIDGIFKAYSNLSYSPTALFLMVISSIYFVGKLIDPNSTETNIYYLCARNVLKAASNSSNVVIPPIAYTIAGVCNLMTSWGDMLTLFMAMWFPYAAKPSKRNGVVATIFSLFFMFDHTSYLNLLILSHSFFLYTQLRDPLHKFVILIFVIVVCFMGKGFLNDFVGIQELNTKYSKSRGSTPSIPADVPKTATVSNIKKP